MEKYSVALASVVEEMKLDKIYVPDNFNEIADLNGDNRISVTDVRYLVLKISYGQV